MAGIKSVSDILKEITGKDPVEQHQIVYDSSSESLEPIYFYTLDLMGQLAGKTEKIIDNFSSSAGSGHFSELSGKASHMQKEAMSIMQTIGGVLIKSIVNIIYDLKEFELRLSQYDEAKSEDKIKKSAGILALKQIWMDNVDMKRGQGSINALSSGNLNFVTLRDAFMAADSLEKIKDLDLNDRVKRILEPRLQEFFFWKDLSEKELRKRYEIEKSYLKNQVASLKLQTRWIKPYLKAAAQLEQADSSNPGLVTAFNTIIFELTLLGKRALDPRDSALEKSLPPVFLTKKLKRQYYSCVLVDFNFRGIPQKVGQHYAFGGKSIINFRGYALNEDELKMLTQKLEESDLNDAFRLVQGMTTESLDVLKEDLEKYLSDKKSSEEKEEKKSEDVNPFMALLGLGNKKSEKKQEKSDEKITEIKKDDYLESVARNLAKKNAIESCFKIFDVYKKAHGMQSHPEPNFDSKSENKA